jgi:hypothetical protein
MTGGSYASSAIRLPSWDLGLTLRQARLLTQRDAVSEDTRTAIPPKTTLDGFIWKVVA